jgi:Immunity protein 42
MIIGNTSIFAIESQMSQAYERLSFRALGYFVIHIGDYSYGVRSPDATMLACSIESVRTRIAQRGKHIAPFARESKAIDIANSIYNSIYGRNNEKTFFALPSIDFRNLIYANELIWAPDGDQAFDDGSFVLQFDVNNRVRLIGFKTGEARNIDLGTLTDEWLAADTYYQVLETWLKGIEDQWQAMPKLAD